MKRFFKKRESVQYNIDVRSYLQRERERTRYELNAVTGITGAFTGFGVVVYDMCSHVFTNLLINAANYLINHLIP